MQRALDHLVDQLGDDLHTLPWLRAWAKQSEVSLQNRGVKASSDTRKSLDIAALRKVSPSEFGAGTAVSCVHAVATACDVWASRP